MLLRVPDPEPFQFSRIAEDLIGDLRGIPNETPRRQKKRATKSLGQLVQELIVKHHVGESSPEQLIRDHWVALVGSANAAYSHAVTIDPRGKLVVMASHGVVRQELSAHRRTIVQRIKALPGCSHVADLTIRAS